MTAPLPTPRRSLTWRRCTAALGMGILLACSALAWGEWRGWPWLAQPLAAWLSAQLGREVRFEGADMVPATHAAERVPVAHPTAFRLSLLPQVRLHLPHLQVAQPPGLDGPQAPPMLQAQGAVLAWRYRDLWALVRPSRTAAQAAVGAAATSALSNAGPAQAPAAAPPLVLDTLAADQIQLNLRRDAQGRASWHFEPRASRPNSQQPPRATPALDGVRIRHLRLGEGALDWQDAPLALTLQLEVALAPAPANLPGAAGAASSAPLSRSAAASAPASAAAGTAPLGLLAQGRGRWHGQPLSLSLRSADLSPWLLATQPGEDHVPVQLRLQAGRAQVAFDGTLGQPLNGLRLAGSYQVAGPSLAAVGEPLGLVLPSTAAFAVRGRLQHAQAARNTVLDELRVGRSQITGALQYQADRAPRPRLAGQLRAATLWLADLGPSLGAAPAGVVPETRAPAARDRLLPDRPLNLPVLRTMDAEVAVAAQRLETGTAALQDPLSAAAHVSLEDGVLRLRDLDARLAGGRLRGQASLDARVRPARWQAQLRLRQINLAQWVHQPRNQAGAPPYLAGRLAANLDLRGSGQSTAQWLASADGQALLHLRQGQVSHLALELAGLDLAQSLGVVLRGDQPLKVDCAVADLVLQRGVLRPRVAVLDSADSTVWLQGQVSLADEQLDLLARVAPKDRSLLALRSPVQLQGPWVAPRVTVQATPLLRRLGLAGVLGTVVNPAAALLPLLDLGDDESEPARQACARARRPAELGPGQPTAAR